MGDLPQNALLDFSAAGSLPLQKPNALMPMKAPADFEAAMPRQWETKLGPQQMPGFQAYVANLARLQGRPVESVMRDTADYDLQGAYLSGFKPDERGHLGDRYKKPNHPTFSDQSQYHGVGGNMGGRWAYENGRDVFYAGPTNVANMGGPQGLQGYFQKYEPGVQLVLPPLPPR